MSVVAFSQLPLLVSTDAADVDKSFGSKIDDVMAKIINTTPPTSVTVLTEIFDARILPPITASPVHIECPIIPPVMTPIKFSRAARIIVVI